MRRIAESGFKCLLPVAALALLAGAMWVPPVVMAYPTSEGPVVPLKTAAVKPDKSILPEKEAAPYSRYRAAFNRLPLYFEENRGQTTDPRVKYKARGGGYTLYITPEEAVVVMSGGRGESEKRADVRMRLVGANTDPEIEGLDKQAGIVNYLLGNDESKWLTEVPTYSKVRYKAVYPGTDVVYYGNQGRIEYDFILEPGADPDRIKMDIAGARAMSLDAEGSLVIETAAGRLIQPAPIVYQKIDGENHTVSCRYQLLADNRVGFKVDSYDPSKKLVIDPKLEFSTFLGGSSTDIGRAIWAGELSDGNTYIFVAGETQEKDFPEADPYPGSDSHNGFIVKMQWTESSYTLSLVYSTYLGAEEPDWVNDMVVDSDGFVYVTGATESAFFPLVNSVQPTNCHYWDVPEPCSLDGAPVTWSTTPGDAFISKIRSTGTALQFSTYMGSEVTDVGQAITIDSNRNVYVVGRSSGKRLGNYFWTPVTPIREYMGGFVSEPQDPDDPDPLFEDAFLVKLTASGDQVSLLTYLGGGGDDVAHSVAVDSSNNIYVVGQTDSCSDSCEGLTLFPDFPTANAFQDGRKGRTDGFITKYNPTATTFLYSTYFGGYFPTLVGGGSPEELIMDVEVQNESGTDYTYIGGYTWSDSGPDEFPIKNAYESNIGGYEDGFIAKMDLSQSGADSLIWNTYLGGNREDRVIDIELDFKNGKPIIYATGRTRSYEITDKPELRPFPTSENTFQSQLASVDFYDAFLTKLEASGNPEVADLVYSTYFGGTADENMVTTYESDVDRIFYIHKFGKVSVHNEIAYLTGVTASGDFHTSAPYQSSLNGSEDAYVAMFVKQVGSGEWTGDRLETGSRAPRAVSAYAGDYSGTFTGTLEEADFSGVWEFAVDNNGKISGTASVTGGDTYDITGSVNALGEVTITNWAGTGGTAYAEINEVGELGGEWSTEDTEPPQVIAFTPPDGAGLVSPNTTVTATLDTRVLTSSIKNAFILTDQTGGGTVISGDVTYDPVDSKLTFRVNDDVHNPENPTQFLVSNEYQASIEPGIMDLSGNMAQDYVSWNFTTSSDPFTPIVSPVENATGVALDTIVTATFTPATRRILADTVDETSFYLRNDTDQEYVGGLVDFTNPDPGNVAFTARFTPTSGLEQGKKYTATVTTAITDINGEHLEENYSWSFTTVGSFSVASTSPTTNEANVSRTTNITATFNDDLEPTTVTDTTFFVNNGQIAGTVTYANRVATFNPNEDLAVPGTYAVNLTTGIQNLDGNSLPTPYTWVFTTGEAVDTTAPTVTSTSPQDQATDVALTTAVSATFDSDLDASTVDSANFYLTTDQQTVVGRVDYDYETQTITFTPDGDLNFETTYTVTISNKIKGANGVNLGSTQTFSFTTQVNPLTQPPTITGVIPEENATSIAVDTPITATFDRDMDATSISQTNTSLAQGDNPVSYQISYDTGSRTATITPTNSLDYETVYTVTFTTGVKSTYNINMEQNKTWTFTTEKDPTITPPEVKSTTPEDGDTDVPPGNAITVEFTKDMNANTLNSNTVLIGDGSKFVDLNFSYNQTTRTLTATPQVGYLKVSTLYYLTVTTGVVDQYGLNPGADYRISYTTASSPDLAPPEIDKVFPGADASNVAVSTIITRTFDKSMDPASINANTFYVTDSRTRARVAGTVTYIDNLNMASFEPSSELAYSTTYTGTLTTGVRGANGVSLPSDHVTSFTTEVEPVKPSVPSGGGGGGGCFLSTLEP